VSQQWERLELVLPSNFPVGVHWRLAAQLSLAAADAIAEQVHCMQVLL
jgi:hypothetical protein